MLFHCLPKYEFVNNYSCELHYYYITVYENMGLIKAVNANIQTENVTIASSRYLLKININATIEQCDLSSIKQKSWITTFYII